jgi:hypothetical protein
MLTKSWRELLVKGVDYINYTLGYGVMVSTRDSDRSLEATHASEQCSDHRLLSPREVIR